jgi:hypothetical protein
MIDEDLEAFIDEYTLAEVLEKLANICREKADHIRTSYSDKTLAQTWDDDAKLIDKTASKVRH